MTREALHDLTGAPAAVLFMDNPDLWNTMIEGEQKNWIMTAGSLGGSVDYDDERANREIDESGLIKSHSYSLLGAFEVFAHNKVH